ncbi:hypothetical protein FJW08_23585 [Mesorhizobium sp. B3-2-1]|uniref:4-fold beta flower protein n=1 Tax=Mesorhizobium sp. B3-2-1 TaxID=2589891 RepID=UPI001128ADCE|nr:hypothetical protein [Mesorhizobium sp. B3-2-1]TPI27685.1 hypothetical protein FJW08_23585 [Mesorhizobium sp. B3-2-1]
MIFVHRWNGEYFGWLYEGALYSKDGRHVGFRRRDQIVSVKGKYLGEVRNHRLLTQTAKVGNQTVGGVPMIRMVGTTVKPMDEVPFDLPGGYEEFPLPESV